MWILFLIFSQYSLLAQSGYQCLVLSQNENLLHMKGRKERVEQNSFEAIGKVKSKKGKLGIVVRYLGDKAVIVPSGKWKIVKSALPCETVDSQAILSPQDPLPLEVPNTDSVVTEVESKPGQEVSPVPSTPPTYKHAKGKSSFGVETTAYLIIDSEDFQSGLFPRDRYPLPSGNANEVSFETPYDDILVPNPFIDSIGLSKGWQVGIFYEHPLWSFLHQKWGLGYWQRSFVLETYPVPQTPSFNSVDNLEKQDLSLNVQAIYLKPEWRWFVFGESLPGLSFNIGVQLSFLIQNPVVPIRVGANDLVEVEHKLANEDLLISFHPKIEYDYYGFRFGLEFPNPHRRIQPALSLGYGF